MMAMTPADKALVDAYLAKHKPRRFEIGASGNPIVVLDWLQGQGINAAYAGKGKIRIGRAIVDVTGLFERANEIRRAKGLEPFTIGPVRPRGHFCFNAAPRARREPT